MTEEEEGKQVRYQKKKKKKNREMFETEQLRPNLLGT